MDAPRRAKRLVSAKRLLRFPELNRLGREREAASRGGGELAEIDVVTEYFLLGSWISWLTALAPSALFLGGGSS